MKGLNDMEFKFSVDDIVRIKPGNMLKKLVGAVGIIREQEQRMYYPNEVYLVEFPKSVVDNPIVLDNGIMINGIDIQVDDLELVLAYKQSSKEDEELVETLMNQRTNDKHNTWEVRIRQCDDDKNFTCAELYVNGRFETIEYVKRYYKDKYDARTACVEVCKKLFGVENAEEKSEEIPTPKYYTGKVVCVERNPWFTQGKVYEVEDGNVIDDQGSIYGFIEGVNDMCDQIKVEFIEFVE